MKLVAHVRPATLKRPATATLIFALLSVSVVAGCVSTPSQQQPATEAVTPSATRLPAAVLESDLPKLMDEAGVPGLVAALVQNGKPVWHGAFGVKNADTGEPVEADTIFEAASLSKPVFAYAVLRMVVRGELALEAPLWNSLPYERLEHDQRARAINARLALVNRTQLPGSYLMQF